MQSPFMLQDIMADLLTPVHEVETSTSLFRLTSRSIVSLFCPLSTVLLPSSGLFYWLRFTFDHMAGPVSSLNTPPVVQQIYEAS